MRSPTSEHGHISARAPTAGRATPSSTATGAWPTRGADGRWCGVDDELPLLFDAGCYADFTFPSAPDETQPSIVNQIYWPTGDLGAPTRLRARGAARVGTVAPGPPADRPGAARAGAAPRRGSRCASRPPPSTPSTRRRRSAADTWVAQDIHVAGRPEWVFVKVHTHGAPEAQRRLRCSAMPGARLHEHLARPLQRRAPLDPPLRDGPRDVQHRDGGDGGATRRPRRVPRPRHRRRRPIAAR